MTGIFTSRAFFPLHRIKSASAIENKHGQEMATLRLIDGETISEAMTWDDLGEVALQLIPAERGTSMLHLWTEGDEPHGWSVGRTPLIGWALCLDGQIRPVTPSGVNDGVSEPEDIGNFVEMPDGKVISTSSWASACGFDSAYECMRYALEDRGKKPPEGRPA